MNPNMGPTLGQAMQRYRPGQPAGRVPQMPAQMQRPMPQQRPMGNMQPPPGLAPRPGQGGIIPPHMQQGPMQQNPMREISLAPGGMMRRPM